MKDDTHTLSRSVLCDIRRRGLRSFFPHLASVTGIPFQPFSQPTQTEADRRHAFAWNWNPSYDLKSW